MNALQIKIYKLQNDIIEIIKNFEETYQGRAGYKSEVENINLVEKHASPIETYLYNEEIMEQISTICESIFNLRNSFELRDDKMIHKLRIMYSTLKKLVDETSTFKIDYAKEACNLIKKSEDKIKAIQEHNKLFRQNNYYVKIYSLILQTCLDDFFVIDKNISYKILDIIEDDKKYILTKNLDSHKKAIKSKNLPQTRFGLIPMSDVYPLHELLPIITAEEQKIVTGTDLEKISKKIEAGFVVINSVTPSSIEYNIIPLIDDRVAANYAQTTNQGVNQKIIKRYDTIKELPSKNKWNFSIDIYNGDATKFYVLENMNGTLYRCLAPWQRASKYSVPYHKISLLLNYTPKPTKAHGYQQLAIKNIMNNMFFGRFINASTFESKVIKDVDSSSLRAAAVSAIIKITDKFISKKPKAEEIHELFHSREIADVYVKSLISELIVNEKNMEKDKFTPEILVSFLSELYFIYDKFLSDLHTYHYKNPVKTEDLVNDDRTLIYIKNVVETVVNNTIKLDTNLMTAIYYKYLLMNYKTMFE